MRALANPLTMPGSKRRVMPQILPLLPGPSEVRCVHVPFFGTGASAQHFDAAGYTLGRLSEGSPWIHAVHAKIRNVSNFEDGVETLARRVEAVSLADQRSEYFGWRSMLNQVGPPTPGVPAMSEMIFCLWRMAFNGLIRTNKAGALNMPPGVSASTGRRAKVYDREALREFCGWWRELYSRGLSLLCEDFAETLKHAQPGDLVYLDPPYAGTFSGYLPGGFSTERLVEAIHDLPTGVKWAMSNAVTADEDAPKKPLGKRAPTAAEWAALFPGAAIHPVCRAGTVNSNGADRGKVKEVLIVGAA